MKINQQKVVAKTQDVICDEVHLIKLSSKSDKTAIVSFIVNNEKGERIDTKVIEYKGADFNTFHEDYNSGKFLYEELVEKEELVVTIPKDIEETFVNEVKEEVEVKGVIEETI